VRPGGNRSKGIGFELTVAKQIAKDLGGFDQQRYLPRAPDSGARRNWKGDIVATGELLSIWPFLIECKKEEGWQLEGLLKNDNKHIIREWWTKACEQSFDSYGKTPLLIFARNFQPWLIAYPSSLMEFQDYGKISPFLMFTAFTDTDKTHDNYFANITLYENFIESYLKPVYCDKIKALGILPGQIEG
jgi:hypothetical protein